MRINKAQIFQSFKHLNSAIRRSGSRCCMGIISTISNSNNS